MQESHAYDWDAFLVPRFSLILGLSVLLVLSNVVIPPVVEAGVGADSMPLVPVHLRSQGPAAAGSYPYYLQEGATLTQENHVPYYFPSISARFAVVSSPMPTGYELNAYSNGNDWYQLVVTDNWPGCLAGFAFGYEVWDVSGYSVIGPVCNIAGNLSAGDEVFLAISLNCAAGGNGSACLSFDDVTNGFHKLVIVPQPGGGGVGFLNLNTAASDMGYFTGPMTEVIDYAHNSCVAYNAIPTVGYVINVSGRRVTSFIAWSDQFELTPFQAFPCYAYSTSALSVDSTPLTRYMEATGGGVYGPHWEASQDWSTVSGIAGLWRFQTDVSPINFSIAPSRKSADVGQNLTVSAVIHGGIGPFRCQWTVDGVPRPDLTACSWIEEMSSPGTMNVSAYGIDALQDYATAWAAIVVLPDPVVLSITAVRTTLDVGQSTPFSVIVSRGSGGYSYVWTAASGACWGPGSTVNCTALTVGSLDVSVAINDTNGFHVVSPILRVPVSSDPTLSVQVGPGPLLAHVAWPMEAKLRGGLGPYAVDWLQLPPGCVASLQPANVSCMIASPGVYNVRVRATDANGLSAEAIGTVQVEPSILGLPLLAGYGVIFGVIVASGLATIFAWMAWRRRDRVRPGS